MIAVDTNILARFYCEDPDDAEAKRQRPRARRVMIESSAVFVPLTVVLEFEWVMRGFYAVKTETFCQTIDHLLGMAHAVKDAVDLHRRGLDFADALHWACSAACGRFVTFDDRGFVRRAQALKLVPEVAIPGRAWWARATQSMEHGTDSVEMVTVSVILVSSVHKRMQGVNGIGDLGRRHLNGAQQASQKRPPASFECAGPGVPE